MTENILGKLFEHNNWANIRMIQTCSALRDEQLDGKPISTTYGSIRDTLIHMVSSQRGYLALLTLPVEERPNAPVAFAELEKVASLAGEGLLALARDELKKPLKTQLRTMDGYFVEPWVVMLQVINHATEHREQINNMLTTQGLESLNLDGWNYGEVTNALIPISTGQ